MYSVQVRRVTPGVCQGGVESLLREHQTGSYLPAKVALPVLIMHITTKSAGINFQTVFRVLYKL